MRTWSSCKAVFIVATTPFRIRFQKIHRSAQVVFPAPWSWLSIQCSQPLMMILALNREAFYLQCYHRLEVYPHSFLAASVRGGRTPLSRNSLSRALGAFLRAGFWFKADFSQPRPLCYLDSIKLTSEHDLFKIIIHLYGFPDFKCLKVVLCFLLPTCH